MIRDTYCPLIVTMVTYCPLIVTMVTYCPLIVTMVTYCPLIVTMVTCSPQDADLDFKDGVETIELKVPMENLDPVKT